MPKSTIDNFCLFCKKLYYLRSKRVLKKLRQHFAVTSNFAVTLNVKGLGKVLAALEIDTGPKFLKPFSATPKPCQMSKKFSYG